MLDRDDWWDRMEWGDDTAYHRGCGGLVTVKHYPAILYAYDGPSPAETYIRCIKCGDIGDDEVSENQQEPCEVCGQALTDNGFPCKRCRAAEEEGGGQDDQEIVRVGGDRAAAGGRSS